MEGSKDYLPPEIVTFENILAERVTPRGLMNILSNVPDHLRDTPIILYLGTDLVVEIITSMVAQLPNPEGGEDEFPILQLGLNTSALEIMKEHFSPEFYKNILETQRLRLAEKAQAQSAAPKPTLQ
jgi:hypothetical protein